MPNFRKMEITIDFNGISMGHLWDVITHYMVNVAETFTDILKYYFLQTNVVKFVKCML